MVRLALQQLLDSVELPIGETERSMERLFGDRGQKSTLAASPVALGSLGRCARYVVLLVTLAAIWGASYLFIEIALRDLEPTTMMAGAAS